LLRKLVCRLLDRLLQRAFFRKQPEHHRKAPNFAGKLPPNPPGSDLVGPDSTTIWPMRLLVLVCVVACSAPAGKPRQKTTNPDQCFYGCKPDENSGQPAQVAGTQAPTPAAPAPTRHPTPAGESAALHP